MGEACDKDSDDVRSKLGEVLEQAEAVAPGAEVPVEDGQINRIFVRDPEPIRHPRQRTPWPQDRTRPAIPGMSAERILHRQR